MKGQRGRMHKLVGRALVSLATTALAAVLLAPSTAASPIGDAEAAMMSAWDKAGGASSPLGARKGDVYPVGDGFALNFDGGKMFYSTATGARDVYGPILDKYDSLGGPAGSDLGWPTIDEVPGLSGPDSRVSTFSASDKPVIFWTSEHGAFVVRGALNAAWDKLGSSGGVLGVPIGDETYDGQVTSQKFSGGQVSWNRETKQFTADPAVLAEQLKGLQVPIDPTAAINMAWRAAGGANGPLGAKQGGQYPAGDGIAQNFASGKVFFSPATGANAVESDILAKYESLGGPAGSDLGFPIANESDGGIASSRIATFSATDKPVIFWTSDHGAFVVRGAMKAAWDKLRGPAGKLGAPLGDQAMDGDVITQKFAGGTISWNRAKNTFTTDPANLAALLSGLQVSGQNQPSASAAPHDKGFTSHWWWWLLIAVPLLVLVALLALLGLGWYRRHNGHKTKPDRAADVGFDDGWGHDDADLATENFPVGGLHPPEHRSLGDAESGPHVSWGRGTAASLAEDVGPGAYPRERPSGSEEDEDDFGGLGLDDEDPDAIDTDSILVVSEADLAEAGYPEVVPEEGYPDAGPEDGYPDVVPEDAYPGAVAEDVYPGAVAEDGYPDVVAEDVYPGAVPEEPYPGAVPGVVAEEGYPDVVSEDAYPGAVVDADHPDTAPEVAYADADDPDFGYPDVAVPHAPQDAAYLAADEPDAADPDAEYPDLAVPHTAPDVAFAEAAASDAHPSDAHASETDDSVAAARSRRSGRHAAADTDDDLELAPRANLAGLAGARASGRPTIHMPLEDPYQVPDGYPIKASARFGLYYTPGSDLYQDTLAEIWMASEEVAQANGFIRAD